MQFDMIPTPRRTFLRGTGFATAALWTTPGLFAEELMRTAAMTDVFLIGRRPVEPLPAA